MSSSSSSTPSLQLFPFLAVMVCAMGALILLLLVTTRQMQHADQQRAIAEAEKQLKLQTPEEPTGPELQPSGPTEEELAARAQSRLARQAARDARREANTQAKVRQADRETEWQRQAAAAEIDLDRRRQNLREAKSEVDGLRQRLRVTETNLQKLSDKSSKAKELEKHDARTLTAAEQEHEKLTDEIRQAQARLADLKRSHANSESKFAFLPYDGVSGTTRRPIHIECSDKGIRFIPENELLQEDDLRGFTTKYNPLVLACDSLIRYWKERARTETDPQKAGAPYILLIVRPSGTVAYNVARVMLTPLGDDFGYELIEEDFPLQLPPADPEAKVILQRAVAEALKTRSQAIAQGKRLGESRLGHELDGDGQDDEVFDFGTLNDQVAAAQAEAKNPFNKNSPITGKGVSVTRSPTREGELMPKSGHNTTRTELQGRPSENRGSISEAVSAGQPEPPGSLAEMVGGPGMPRRGPLTQRNSRGASGTGARGTGRNAGGTGNAGTAHRGPGVGSQHAGNGTASSGASGSYAGDSAAGSLATNGSAAPLHNGVGNRGAGAGGDGTGPGPVALLPRGGSGKADPSKTYALSNPFDVPDSAGGSAASDLTGEAATVEDFNEDFSPTNTGSRASNGGSTTRRSQGLQPGEIRGDVADATLIGESNAIGNDTGNRTSTARRGMAGSAVAGGVADNGGGPASGPSGASARAGSRSDGSRGERSSADHVAAATSSRNAPGAAGSTASRSRSSGAAAGSGYAPPRGAEDEPEPDRNPSDNFQDPANPSISRRQGTASAGTRSGPMMRADDPRARKQRVYGDNPEARKQLEKMASAKSSKPAMSAMQKRDQARTRWGGSNTGQLGYERQVSMSVAADKMIIGDNEIEIVVEPNTTPDELVHSVLEGLDAHSQTWGAPPTRFYWVPFIKFNVQPGGDTNYERLHGALREWGIFSESNRGDGQKPATTAAKHGKPATTNAKPAPPGRAVVSPKVQPASAPKSNNPAEPSQNRTQNGQNVAPSQPQESWFQRLLHGRLTF